MKAFHLSSKAIISPKADLLCVGGLSIFVMTGLIGFVSWHMLSAEYAKGTINMVDLFIFQVLLNWPHFVVSYKLLYSDTGNFRRYPLATICVPAVLLAICVVALVITQVPGRSGFVVDQQVAYYMWLAAAFYLAWHYTGQAWGMVAVFAHLSETKLLGWERQVLRLGLKSMIVWHVVWGIQGMPEKPSLAFFQSDGAMISINLLASAAFCAGLIAYWSILRRQKSIDLRMFVPWLALFMWYLVLFLEPDAFMFVQLSHALQYIIFPARIELNKRLLNKPQKRSKKKSEASTPKNLAPLAILYVVGVAAGLLIFYVPDLLIGDVGGMMTIGGMIALAVNIHHYYADGAIWKLRDKSVRDQLFGKLKEVRAA